MLPDNDSERTADLQPDDARRKIDQGWASLQRGQGIDGREFFTKLAREEERLLRKRKRS